MRIAGICISMTLAGLMSGTGCLPPAPIEFTDSFDNGLNQWTQGADVPLDPNNPGQTVAWSIEVSQDQAHSGHQSARMTLDGSQDDGTIWLQRAFDVSTGQAYTVSVSFWLWSESESFNTLAKAAAYAGPAAPVGEANFDVSQPANQVAGWRQYSYQFESAGNQTGELFVALGISVVWETQVTYYIDDVQVEIRPR